LFTVISGPTQENKARGSEKRELAERHEKRIEFWEGLLKVLNRRTGLYRNVSASPDNWLSAGAGVSGLTYQIIIRMNNASLQLVIDRRNTDLTKKVFDYFYNNKETIEGVFGYNVIWRRMDGQVSSRIQFDIEGYGLSDKTTWESGYEAIADKLILWDKAFKPYIKQVLQIS
jgi:hypothetical protein